MNSYTASDLMSAYVDVGVCKGSTVYVTGNLGRLGNLVGPSGSRASKEEHLQLHTETLLKIIGSSGTIIFPTHSWAQVGSTDVFDINATPADYLFSEYLRRELPNRRQLHPFASVAASGSCAADIISQGISRHAYGVNSPWAVMVELEAVHVSLGMPARKAMSAVHHCEQLACVPYRYTKTFSKRFRVGDYEGSSEFCLFVTYRNADLVRDRNQKIFALDGVAAAHRKADIGRAGIESVRLDQFVRHTVRAMQVDPYIWLNQYPKRRPWEL